MSASVNPPPGLTPPRPGAGWPEPASSTRPAHDPHAAACIPQAQILPDVIDRLARGKAPASLLPAARKTDHLARPAPAQPHPVIHTGPIVPMQTTERLPYNNRRDPGVMGPVMSFSSSQMTQGLSGQLATPR